MGALSQLLQQYMHRAVKEARCSHKTAEFCCGGLNSIHASATKFYLFIYFCEMTMTDKSFKADFGRETAYHMGSPWELFLKISSVMKMPSTVK